MLVFRGVRVDVFNHPFQQKGHLEESARAPGTFLEKIVSNPNLFFAHISVGLFKGLSKYLPVFLFQTFDQTLGLICTLSWQNKRHVYNIAKGKAPGSRISHQPVNVFMAS